MCGWDLASARRRADTNSRGEEAGASAAFDGMGTREFLRGGEDPLKDSFVRINRATIGVGAGEEFRSSPPRSFLGAECLAGRGRRGRRVAPARLDLLST